MEFQFRVMGLAAGFAVYPVACFVVGVVALGYLGYLWLRDRGR